MRNFLLLICILSLQFIEVGSSLLYGTVGGGILPSGQDSVSLDLGRRYRTDHQGVDPSHSPYLDGEVLAKARYRYYPSSKGRHRPFFEFGGGMEEDVAKRDLLTGEFSMGCELNHDQRVKPTLQFNMSQPVHHFHGSGRRNWSPTFTLQFGIGW